MIPEGALSNLVVGLMALVGEQEQKRVAERESYTRGAVIGQVVSALMQARHVELNPAELADKPPEDRQRAVARTASEIAQTAFVIIDAVEAEARCRIRERRKSQQPTAPGGEA